VESENKIYEGLVKTLQETPQLKSIINGLYAKNKRQLVYGLVGSLEVFWTAAFYEYKTPLVILTENLSVARELAFDLKEVIGRDVVGVLPARDRLPLGIKAFSPERLAERITVLTDLVLNKKKIIILPVEALGQPLMPRQTFGKSLIFLKRGTEVDREKLLTKLDALGYKRELLVESPGQVGVRGEIVDVFPLNSSYPYRLDFFGDEIESIRCYDSQTQVSLEEVSEIIIPPAMEIVLEEEGAQRACQKLEELITENAGDTERARRLREFMAEYLQQIEMGRLVPGLEPLLPLFFEKPDSILDYFHSPLLILKEPTRLKETYLALERQWQQEFIQWLEDGNALAVQSENFRDYSFLAREMGRFPSVSYTLLPQKIPGTEPDNVVNIRAQTVPVLMGKEKLVLDEIRSRYRNGYSIILNAPAERLKRLQEILEAEGFNPYLCEKLPLNLVSPQVYLLPGRISIGFAWPDAHLVFLSQKELYGTVYRSKADRRKASLKTSGISLSDLQEGDFVVHSQYGIGRYEGIRALDVNGTKRDYLVIHYAGEDRLYLPTDQVGLLQKYMGAEHKAVHLHKLGGNEWAKAKEKAQESAEKMAKELIKIHAYRKSRPGHAYSPDTVWQKEFEEAFAYEETPDQLKAIEEVKKDMESSQIMDRLICGDVGYGKTEVALRAAFKAVMDSKQVAVLVPTTVLAQQHYRVFKERFAPFPVNIAVLSRFQTQSQQKRIVRALKKGEVDIVIGTHRLLSSDIQFKDLGLVVVDEEQRFGVMHKEKLKMMTKDVDILTMTATPIPRTLSMALTGIRDVTMIETPPEDRFPVQTYVLEYSPQLAKEVLGRELERGGQAYVVHNRIGVLNKIAFELKNLLPDARIAVAHGRMPEKELEETMLAFAEGEYDILVCTTIVENGLDITNANTLLVLDSDLLGLSQLYQLRGRIGRSSRLAFAYFTYDAHKMLTEEAEKRLSAIREFTQFGAGFKIAMRDLEIRGAGNILGAEQHGHIVAVGFELYLKLLEDAIRKLKTEEGAEEEIKSAPQREVTIELAVDAYFSDDYLPLTGVKLDFYRRLLNAENLKEVKEIEKELKDRFGKLPPEAKNLLTLSEIRILAAQTGIEKIEEKNKAIRFTFAADTALKGPKLMELAAEFPRQLTFYASEGLVMEMAMGDLKKEGLLWRIRDVLYKMNQVLYTEKAAAL